ncbi:diguanylate cyclase [Rhodoferax sp. WC2427]|uniref:GGDEF domain-containing protein n=1 Tax=Rhodoferax sp. WC2427 TaxID=3234144 RepID=UPI0034675FBF
MFRFSVLRAGAWPPLVAVAALVAAQVVLAWLPLAWPVVVVQMALVAGWVALAGCMRSAAVPEATPVLGISAEQALEAALDVLPDNSTFALFDAQERLLLVSARTRALYPQSAPFMLPGVSFEAVLRHTVALGEMPESEGQEAWIQQRLAAFRLTVPVQVQELPQDRWMRISQRRLPDGSTVVLRAEITDTVRKERALERARQEAHAAQSQLSEALEAMPIGIELYDAHDRLVYFNRKMGEMRPWFTLEEGRGLTHEALVRIGLRQGFPQEAMGREDEWMATHLAARGNRAMPEVRSYPIGVWMHAYESRTPSGYIVAVRLDITEMVLQRQALEQANHRLAQLSATDGLTGIGNRRHFDAVLATEWLRGARQQEPLALLMIDIDHFKLYNDHYGHLAGDACLRRVAQLLTTCVRRAGELVARYGGEEFVLLLPGTDQDHARMVAQHCMDALGQERIPHAGSPTADHVTLSIGIAHTVPHADRKADTLVDAADSALYRAKNAGRQQFEVSRL